MMGLVPLEEETRELAFCLHHVKTQYKGGCLQTRKRAYARNWICHHLDVNSLPSRTVQNKCFFFVCLFKLTLVFLLR